MRHTPGPWKLSGFDDGDGVSLLRISTDEKGRQVATHQILPFYDCDLEQGLHGQRHKADKALIEAAPELLEALIAIIDHIPADWWTVHGDMDILTAAKHAAEKAVGT